MTHHGRARTVADERWLAREHFKDNARETINVRSSVDVLVGCCLLKAHVGWSSDRQTAFGYRLERVNSRS